MCRKCQDKGYIGVPGNPLASRACDCSAGIEVREKNHLPMPEITRKKGKR
ncbi:hypothetical protein KAR91_49525 [Candidatus Pacearchaeota archaeon]|nr:hypothetical protein [Candidatus Pacearchaeota archaeon]